MKQNNTKKLLALLLLGGAVCSAVIFLVKSRVDSFDHKKELVRVELPFDYGEFASKTLPLPIDFQADGLGENSYEAKIKFHVIKDVFPHKDFIRIVLGGFVGLNVNGVPEVREVAMNLDLRVEPRDGNLYVAEVLIASIRPFEAPQNISEAIAEMAPEMKLIITEKIDRSAMPLLEGCREIKEMTKSGIVVYKEED